MRLPGGDDRREGNGVTVNDQVELASPPASAATQRVVSGLSFAFFEAPAAAREARTLLPSTHHRSQSM